MSDRSWTQKDLALESGVSQPTISRYLNQTTEPKASELIALARSFGVSLDVLTGHKVGGDSTLREDPAIYGAGLQEWRDRAKSAEAKVMMLKNGMEGLLKNL